MMVGPGGLEPPTSRLSGVRSNQLSYGPMLAESAKPENTVTLSLRIENDPSKLNNNIANGLFVQLKAASFL